jgi:hypothetical protein
MSQAAIVKVENGQVKVFNSAGSGLYSWGTGTGSQQAVRVSLMGDEIHVTRADGWTVICTHSGSQKRMVK